MVMEDALRYSGGVIKLFTAPGWSRKLALLLLLCIGPPAVTRAGYKPGAGWPEVSTPFFHAATPAQAGARITHWRLQAGIRVGGYRDSGSMRPLLHDTGEMLVMETCRPETPLEPGLLVVFNRGDCPAVLHYIAAMSGDGRSLYLSGVNCRYSDGWFPRSRVAFVVREIITSPPPA